MTWKLKALVKEKQLAWLGDDDIAIHDPGICSTFFESQTFHYMQTDSFYLQKSNVCSPEQSYLLLINGFQNYDSGFPILKIEKSLKNKARIVKILIKFITPINHHLKMLHKTRNRVAPKQ